MKKELIARFGQGSWGIIAPCPLLIKVSRASIKTDDLSKKITLRKRQINNKNIVALLINVSHNKIKRKKNFN